MSDNSSKKPPKDEKSSPAEKPVSLWGAPFRDVLDALLKTKPMPKEKGKESKGIPES